MATSGSNPTPGKKAAPPSLSNLMGRDKKDDTSTSETKDAPEVKKDAPEVKDNENKNDKNTPPPMVPGPADVKDKDQKTTFRPDEIDDPVDNTDTSDTNTSVDDNDKADKPVISNQVVGTVPNKTPAELAAETPKQTASRYGIDQSVTDEDADNPRVQAYRDTHVNQVPSGTHLHPDIAKDMLNRGISEQHTDNAQVKRTVTEYYDFAPDAEHNDKF